MIDGRGDFALGNVYHQSLGAIFNGARARELRRLVLATGDAYCAAIGKRCPLKSIPAEPGEDVPVQLRFLEIEPTTACNLRCLACPVRDFDEDLTWRDAYADGGPLFLAWDGLRRLKQQTADRIRRAIPLLDTKTAERFGRRGALLLRGRIPRSRTGTLPIRVLKKLVTEAGPAIERVNLASYGEPFLYGRLVEALRHIRSELPKAEIAFSTNGMRIPEPVEETIVRERLLDCLVFSIDGCEEESYRRYRIGGRFDVAFSNLVRFHRHAAGTGIRVIWQYVVFRWNDRDGQFKRAIAMAEGHGIPIWFDFARTWGRSRRCPDEFRHLVPYLKPFTGLPGEPRWNGV
jgi:pyruvate-formate lyase-activating enzyme